MLHKILGLLIAMALIWSCAGKQTSFKRSPYGQSELGLPEKPKNVGNGDFEALVDEYGQPAEGVTNQSTQIEVADKDCPVTNHTGVYLSASYGSYYIVDLKSPCVSTDNKEYIYQGYIKAEHVDVFAEGMGAKCAALTADTGAASTSEPATVEPLPEADRGAVESKASADSGMISSCSDYQSAGFGKQSDADASGISHQSDADASGISHQSDAGSACRAEFVPGIPGKLYYDGGKITSVTNFFGGGSKTPARADDLTGVPGKCFRKDFGEGCPVPTLQLTYTSGTAPKQVTVVLEKLSTDVQLYYRQLATALPKFPPPNGTPSSVAGIYGGKSYGGKIYVGDAALQAAQAQQKLAALDSEPVADTMSTTIDLGTAKYSVGQGVYAIPFTEVVEPSDWHSAPINIRVMDAAGTRDECNKTEIRLQSPLVLDLADRGAIETVPPTQSGVSFAIDKTGKAKHTGWITPDAGFLVLDRNHNGAIDDASEMFGDSTPVDNAYAFNGFVALAAYDSDGDRFIDKRDPIFSRLSIWVDANVDGVSQAAELKPLRAHGITRLGTGYKQNFTGDSIQGQNFFVNDLRYTGRYFGPQRCGAEGCLMVDVYFGTIGDLSARK